MIHEFVKKGFLVEVSTWENDADNNQVAVIGGLTKEEARFVVQYCLYFKSVNSLSDRKNKYILGNSDIEDIDYIVEDVSHNYGITKDRAFELAEHIQEDIIGTWFDYSKWRVVDNVKSYHSPGVTLAEVEFEKDKTNYINEMRP